MSTTRRPAASPGTSPASTRSSGPSTSGPRSRAASTRSAVPLSAYGDPLGEAFQLRDDLLGAFGDEATTGKPVGDDLREGKPTPLLALATEAADPRQAEVLARVGRPDLNANDIAALQLVLHDTGAVAAIESSIDELTERAVASLAASGLTPEAIAELTSLADFVAHRSG